MGTAIELKQLAHLLRTGTEYARDVTSQREADAREISMLIDQALVIADRLDQIALRSIDSSSVESHDGTIHKTALDPLGRDRIRWEY